MTFPAAAYLDVDTDAAIPQLERIGATDVVANDDGTYTATFSRSDYDTYIANLYQQTSDTLDAMPTGGFYPKITDVSYASDLSTVTLTTSETELSDEGSFSMLQAGIKVVIYQKIAGKTVSCTVTLQDADGNVLSTATYPAAITDQKELAGLV